MSLSGSFDATRESPMRTSGSTIKRALTPMIIRPLAAIFGVAVALGVPNQTPAAEDAVPTLWYTQPAVKWTDALPVGNGRMGAMVFGGTTEERVQFNEGTLWTGHPHDYARPDAAQYLAPIRQLIAEGKTEAAVKLAKEHFIGDPARQKAYQPFGDLRLHFTYRSEADAPSANVAAGPGVPGEPAGSAHGQDLRATQYRRELDLDAAIARVSYQVGSTTFRREVFAS